jgi:hypothetical protein
MNSTKRIDTLTPGDVLVPSKSRPFSGRVVSVSPAYDGVKCIGPRGARYSLVGACMSISLNRSIVELSDGSAFVALNTSVASVHVEDEF